MSILWIVLWFVDFPVFNYVDDLQRSTFLLGFGLVIIQCSIRGNMQKSMERHSCLMWTNTLYDDIFSLYDDTYSLYDDTFPLYDDTSSLYDDTSSLNDDTFPLYDDTFLFYDDTLYYMMILLHYMMILFRPQ